MTPEEIEEIRERTSKATPGPWSWDSMTSDLGTRYHHVLAVGGDNPSYGKGIADTYHSGPLDIDGETIPPTFGNRDNANFIASARTDIPRLLTALEEAEARVEELEEIIHAAGILMGEDAERVLREMEHGTPDTPERRATIRRADKIRRALRRER